MEWKLISRFFSKFVIEYDGCWRWTGSFGGGANTYPRFSWNGKTGYAHRFSCEFFHGPIPIGYTVDHLCSHPYCVNPAHLEAVTMQVNGLRGKTFQGDNARKTHCPHGHEYTIENLIKTKRKTRQCKICARERSRMKQGYYA